MLFGSLRDQSLVWQTWNEVVVSEFHAYEVISKDSDRTVHIESGGHNTLVLLMQVAFNGLKTHILKLIPFC